MREDEPTSIIAFTLASKTCRDKLKSVSQSQDSRKTEKLEKHIDSVEENIQATTDCVTIEDATDGEENGKKAVGTHISYGQL